MTAKSPLAIRGLSAWGTNRGGPVALANVFGVGPYDRVNVCSAIKLPIGRVRCDLQRGFYGDGIHFHTYTRCYGSGNAVFHHLSPLHEGNHDNSVVFG